MTERYYDYIICGGGCAGLSLAYYLSLHETFDKKVLIIDKDRKDSNDRTWSFWEKEDGPFESIVKTSWSKIDFYSSVFSNTIDINPYRYKKILSADFYAFVKSRLAELPNFTIVTEPINRIVEEQNDVRVITSQRKYNSQMVFKSYLNDGFDFGSNQNVLQHFMGWEIETEEDSFDEDKATFMDFRIDQKEDVRFLYVLPDTPKKALVEVAIFSNSILEKADYESILENYISDKLSIQKYKIKEKEFGIIPMTTYPFEKHNTARIKHIGTAGGWVKASSGYAFSRIQEKSKLLAKALTNGKNIDAVLSSKNRFRKYDRIFLNVLLTQKATGDEVFGQMFKKLKSDKIFKFLDEETSFIEELGIFTGPPTMPFIKAFFEEL